jgi:ferredoxin-NADP reductase
VVAGIRQNGADAKTLVLKSADGGPLAPFRAGQYVSVLVSIGGSNTTRSYSLCGSPAWAKRGEYNITVKRDDAGFVSPYIQDNWAVGQKVVISGPQGNLYYEPLRDAKKVVALAGGSGITPFMGMAYAIRDGYEDFDLTIIFGSRTADGIVYKKELDEVAAACGKVHVVHVLSDEEKPGYEHGFITSQLIAKYGGEAGTYSIFMCGPQAMYNFLDGEIEKLGLRRKFVRRELFGAIKDPWNQPGYPAEMRGRSFALKVTQCGTTYETTALADEPLLVAMERAGIKAPSRCRSGECGWCRSRLLSGQVFIPEKTDGRRAADVQFGYIHPCSSFPASDVVLDVPARGME